MQSHDDTRGDIPVGSVVQVKWGDSEDDLFTARVTGRRISVTYQVHNGRRTGGESSGEKWAEGLTSPPPPLPTHTHTHLGTSSRFPFKYSIKKTRCSRMTVTLGYVGRPHVYIYVSGKELKCGGTPIREPDFGLVTSANSSFIISQVRP